MPRGSDHRNDDPSDRDMYWKWDLEDLVEVVSWVREVGRGEFSSDQVRAMSAVASYSWGMHRVRRVLRVGAEVGWLAESVGRYSVTGSAVATLPPMTSVCNRVSRENGVPAESIRQTFRIEMRRAFDAAGKVGKRGGRRRWAHR